MFQKGDLAFDKYRILDLIGKGAFGEVYLTEHIYLNINRALKCIRRDPNKNDIWSREADILKNLRHPSIPIIYDIEEKDDCVCIIEEYVEGVTLNSINFYNSRFYVKKIARLMLQLCEVLEYLHGKGIVHGDIKPENIVCKNGRIYLLDYGNARIVGKKDLPLIGTKGFVAPEAYINNELERSSDVYAIGVLMLLLATGKKNVEALDEIKSKKFKRLVTKCLSHSEKERVKSVKELAFHLKNFISKKAEVEKLSLKIGFAGAYSHCGVTHCALLAGKFCHRKGYKTVLSERNSSNDYLKILSHKNRVSFSSGTFKAEGVLYRPWYYQCVNPETEPTAERFIMDFGTLSENLPKEVMDCDVLCIVTGARIYERDKTLSLIRQIKARGFNGEIYVLVNLADMRNYREFIRNKEIVNPIRVGYHPEI